MGLFDASTSNGGSVNSAQSGSQSQGYSLNYPIQANANAASAADIAYQRQKELNEATMNFNREEAQKNRDWQEQMANTIYTRSIENMKQAGINPILAAGIGLSGASVTSGAQANISGSTAPLAQTFMGAESANSANSWGESEGSSWNHAESGLATWLTSMGSLITGILGKMNSSNTINVAIDMLKDMGDRVEETTEGLKSKDKKENQKTTNKMKNGSDNPFVKGTTAYDMYELQKATESFKVKPD